MRKLIAILLLLAAPVIAGLYFIQGWSGAGPAQKETVVVIAPGSSLAQAARSLEAVGILASADRFLIQARVLGGSEPIKAGEYAMAARISPAEVLRLLQSGKTLQRLIMIPEGLPSVLVHERLMNAATLTGGIAVPGEGTVLPDSYDYQRGELRSTVLKRMQTAMTKTVDQLWGGRKPHSVVTTKGDAVTLASVVEKETGKASERRMVAGVYSNRIRLGMPLQADPTVIYPVTRGKPLGRRILRSELQADNGYNTYAKRGLPIGPIANPGRASIAAVLDPEPTNALYFVADGTGGHVFADTLEQHNENVRKWFAIRRARGEM